MGFDWMDSAACADDPHPDAWFPAPGFGGNAASERAMRFCLACPVRSECLEFALSFERAVDDTPAPANGIFGTTATNREHMFS